ncbi:MAG: IPTL-CTERM sorting domain-containing protein [Bacteroidota bacterium]
MKKNLLLLTFVFLNFSLFGQGLDLTMKNFSGKKSTPVTLTNSPDKTVSCQSALPSYTQGGGLSFGSHSSITDVVPGIPTSILLADDFPVTQQAAITGVMVTGETNNPGVVNSITLDIYDDNGGDPGTIVFSETFAGYNSTGPVTLTIIPTNCPVLPVGTYWLSVHASTQSGAGAFRLFADPNPFGQMMHWTDPGDFLGTCPNPSGWSEYNDCFPNPPTPGIVMQVDFCVPTPIPTLGQWGLIIFALLILTFGNVTVAQPKMSMASGSGMNFSIQHIPFDKASFTRWLFIVALALFGVFTIAIQMFGYELTSADIPGSIVAIPIVAYNLHLIFGASESDS